MQILNSNLTYNNIEAIAAFTNKILRKTFLELLKHVIYIYVFIDYSPCKIFYTVNINTYNNYICDRVPEAISITIIITSFDHTNLGRIKQYYVLILFIL